MSSAWIISMWAITAFTGSDRCELLYLKEKIAAVRAVAMSSNGAVLLSHYGSGNGYTAVVQVLDDKPKVWPLKSPYPWLQVIGVDNREGILVNHVDQVANGDVMRCFIMRGTSIEPIWLEPILPSRMHSARGKAIGGSGEVFGGAWHLLLPNGNVDPFGWAFVWRDGQYQKLGKSRSIFFISAVARIPLGVVGYVFHSGAEDAHIPVLFHDGSITRLPLPSGISYAMPRAASADGSLMVGLSEPVARGLTIVWDGGVPTIPSFRKLKWANATLVAVAEGGSMAVGSIPLGRDRVSAVAWQRESGLQLVEEIAAERGVVLPFGWRLAEGVGVSPDGKTIFGTAVNWKGQARPFRLWLDKRTSVK